MQWDKFVCKINNLVCGEITKIRDSKSLKVISNAINIALYDSKNDKELILQSSMQVAALIKLLQPFDDGNHRTGLIVFGWLIQLKGYSFDFETALIDMQQHKLNIPTLYSEEDQVGRFDSWRKYIDSTNINEKENALF